MPTTGNLWKQIETEAANQAARLGIAGKTAEYNAFFHIYASARLVQLKGEAGAFIRGSGLELKNHWDYRGDNNSPDPNQRRDSFRDLWNNGVGREIGKIGVFNNWSPDQIAEYSRNTVTQKIGAANQTVAIVDISRNADGSSRDKRMPDDLSRLSTWNYFSGSPYPSTGDVHSVAPPGTAFPPPSPSIGSDSASRPTTPSDLRVASAAAPATEASVGRTIRASLDPSAERDTRQSGTGRYDALISSPDHQTKTPYRALRPQLILTSPADGHLEIFEDAAKRMRDLEGLMGDRHSEYWRGPKADTLQQEYRDLIEARGGGEPRDKSPSFDPERSRTLIGINADKPVDGKDSALTDRIGEIEGLMADRYSEYWQGPKADVLQQEYRDLIELRDKDKRREDELSLFAAAP